MKNIPQTIWNTFKKGRVEIERWSVFAYLDTFDAMSLYTYQDLTALKVSRLNQRFPQKDPTIFKLFCLRMDVPLGCNRVS